MTDLVNRLRSWKIRLLAYGARKDLSRLAVLFGTDKWNSHWYTPHYEEHFRNLRGKRLNLLEIGIGGYANPREGCHSLRMWKAYFRKGRIYGIDVYDKKSLEEPRIHLFQGSQDDEAFLRSVSERAGGFDIVVDDGSHLNEQVIKSFEVLFPLLREGGIYVVEDTQFSYWPGCGGNLDDPNDPKTIMGYFKRLADGLNYEERLKPGYAPTYLDQHIIGIHFYHNLVFVLKGDNREGSNVVRNNDSDIEWLWKGGNPVGRMGLHESPKIPPTEKNARPDDLHRDS